MLQRYDARRSSDGAPHHRSTVDTSDVQQAPDLKPLKINKNNFAGLEAQGEHGLHCFIFPVVLDICATACLTAEMLPPAGSQDTQTLFCASMHCAFAASSTRGRFFL